MNCPCCKGTKVFVYSGYAKGDTYKRYRKCPECNRCFSTVETYCAKDVIQAAKELVERKVNGV